MPRIAHVISTPEGFGGAERVLAALVAGGAERGWEQLVLNPFARDTKERTLREMCPGARYEAMACTRLQQVPRVRRWLKRCLEAFRPSITQAHLFHALVTVASLPSRSVGSRVATHHHGDFLEAQGRKMELWLDRAAGRRYDAIIAVSGAVREFLVSRYGYESRKIITIPSGWQGNPPLISGIAQHPTIVCTANFRPEKGHSLLLAAFASLLQDVPSAELVLVGDGPTREDLRRRAGELGISERVRFTGAVADVWPYLEQAHTFVLPSLSEPLGIAVMEAMAAGVPVVASRIGGIPELVRDGITGTLVPPGDHKALATALVDILGSPDKRTAMGAAGRRAAESLRIERMVARYLDLYERLIGSEPRGKV